MPNAINSPPATAFDRHVDAGEDSTGILGAVIDAYREEGYERGYDRASRDLLDSLVGITERFLREAEGDANWSRQIVYAFVEFLEREIQATSGDVAGYVSGGLGI
jgi:hypothetical protein